jgi:hypothetical protein
MEKTEYPDKVYEDKLELFDKLLMSFLYATFGPIIIYIIWIIIFDEYKNGAGACFGLFVALLFRLAKP